MPFQSTFIPSTFDAASEFQMLDYVQGTYKYALLLRLYWIAWLTLIQHALLCSFDGVPILALLGQAE